MVWIFVLTHIAAFVFGALVFRNNKAKGEQIVDVFKK